MIASVLGSRRIYAVENILAALVFGFLLAAHCVAVMLYIYPASELLWILSLTSNRLASPIFGAIDFGFGRGPALTFLVLTALTTAPLLAWRLRHRLMTAVSGHVALGTCVLLTLGALQRAAPIELAPSLKILGVVPPPDANSVCLASVTLAMICFCLVNHAMFFHPEDQA